ncbi:hypothetical protein Tco_0916761 [Tanacetum coccineum]
MKRVFKGHQGPLLPSYVACCYYPNAGQEPAAQAQSQPSPTPPPIPTSPPPPISSPNTPQSLHLPLHIFHHLPPPNPLQLHLTLIPSPTPATIPTPTSPPPPHLENPTPMLPKLISSIDSLELAQRLAKKEELLTEQEEKKSSKLSKSMLGSELQGEDFAKKMVDLNQGSWKINQLKKLSFAEVKEEFDKLVKQIESFALVSFEATKASLKRFGEELQTKTPKRLKEDKDDE